VAFTFDYELDKYELFVDGQSAFYVEGPPRGTPTQTFSLGGVESTFGQYFYLPGLLDEVEVFNRVLDSTEIEAIFDAGSAGKCKDAPIVLTCNCSDPGLFEPPMDRDVAVKKKNRVLPLKFTLCDKDGFPITDMDISAPVVEVDYTGPAGDLSWEPDDFLSSGHGEDGNQFVYVDGVWRLNLGTKMFDGKGRYTIRVVSTDPAAYVIDPTCSVNFDIQ